MTLEELLAALGIEKSDENREAIAAYVDAQTTSLRRTNAQLKDEKKDALKRLKAFDGLDLDDVRDALGDDDLDADEIASAIKRIKSSDDPSDKSGDAASLKAELEEAQRKLARLEKRSGETVTELEATIERLKTAIKDKHLENTLTRSIMAKQGDAELLLPHIKGRVQTEVDDDGEVVLTVLAPNGEPFEDDKGNPATVDTLVDEYARSDRYAKLFEADKSGPGGKTTKRPSSRSNPWAEGSRNITEQARILKEDPALAKRLKAEAGVK